VIRKLLISSLIAGLSTGLVLADDHEKDNAKNGVSLKIEEWEVPFEGTRSRDPWVGGEDLIWFVGQDTHYVGRLTPSSGEFHKYELEEGAGPHTVISNEKGAWYAGNRAAHIGLLDPESGEIEKFHPPGDGRRDVHTMDFTSDGHIWFSEQGGNRIGLFNSESHEFTMHELSTGQARPYGVVVHNDQPWVVTMGTNQLITVEDGELVEIDLPRSETRSRRLAVSNKGHIWYADWAEGYIGRYDPDSGDIEEWRAPSGDESRPYAVAMDGEDRFWIVETGVDPNHFVPFDTESKTWGEKFEVPSGAGTVRHMVFEPDTNAIWFGTDKNTIGRAQIR